MNLKKKLNFYLNIYDQKMDRQMKMIFKTNLTITQIFYMDKIYESNKIKYSFILFKISR